MRKAAFAAILFLIAGSLIGGTCNDPYVQLSGISGELPAPCQGAFEYTRVDLTPSSITVTKTLDAASPGLFAACASGKHIPTGTLKPSAAETINIKDVVVSSFSQSGDGNGNVQEQVTLNFAKIEIESGGSRGAASFIGSARAAVGRVAVIDSDGQQGGTIQHFQITVRPGGAVTSSIQFAVQPTPPPIKAGMMRVNTAASTAPQPQMNSGFIELRGANGAVLSRYQFTGGTLINGNLRMSRLNLATTAAGLRR
ncbi:MAG TPA: type VI secretion system tube protein Hcp [Thermoanaerobaculia bacterium]|nr:type VI secretion system tube protein Hcp [Thermoanaerobaculia bacterium]